MQTKPPHRRTTLYKYINPLKSKASARRHAQKTRKIKNPKSPPWAGWSKLSPNQSQRKEMLYKCGKKCFLGPRLSFPICNKGTCKINKKGIWAAYIRSAQWENKKRGQYSKVKKKASELLNKGT